MSYWPEWLLSLGVTLLALLCMPWAAPLAALAIVLLVAVAAVLAVGWIVVAPVYLLVRTVRRRAAAHGAGRRVAVPASEGLKPVHYT